jgi:hypothetical protein
MTRQPVQLRLDERDELIKRCAITVAPVCQQLRDLVLR